MSAVQEWLLTLLTGESPYSKPQQRKKNVKNDKKKNFGEDDTLFYSKVNVPGYGLGYVVGYYHGFYAIDFDKFIEGGSTCSGFCRKWHGKWIHEDDIEYGIAIQFPKV